MARTKRRRASTIHKSMLLVALLGIPALAVGQEVTNPPVADTTDQGSYRNTSAGEFTPARGFDLFKSERATLNISFYGLFRYLNQLPGNQTFTDHLGGERTVKARNDLNWHRTMVWLTGFFYTPKFRYNITLWSLPTTQQTLLFGNLQYTVGTGLTVGVGILPNRTARSMQGSWPFWAGSDRQMAEDFFRGGFSSGAFITGRALPNFYYAASINTNVSQLGVTAANDTRAMSYSASVVWLPTTGEFGPRGGLGDLEYHEKLATRFGVSTGYAPNEARYAPDSLPPNETQIRLSDGVSPFETGSLAPGVTVRSLDYKLIAADVGLKYRGFSFQSEYYVRQLSDFVADGPLPETSILDHGFMAEAMYMVVPRLVGVYVVSGYAFDQFDRHPWELGGGTSVYPAKSRSWRLNLHLIHVERSAASSNFGYYTAGQTGTILSLGTDILL
jgi:hypothetical protein